MWTAMPSRLLAIPEFPYAQSREEPQPVEGKDKSRVAGGQRDRIGSETSAQDLSG